MTTIGTCDQCKHYLHGDREPGSDASNCAKVWSVAAGKIQPDDFSAVAMYGYEAWVAIGPKFGCIKWEGVE